MDILRVIEQFESMAASATRVPGFRKKILIEVDHISNLGEELRQSVPANIQEAHEVLNQKDSILNQARMEADRIKNTASDEVARLTAAAQQRHQDLVDDTEVVKAAQDRAEEIKSDAITESTSIMQAAQDRASQVQGEAEVTATQRCNGADQYAREVLFGLEEQLSDALGQVRRGIDSLRTTDSHVQSLEDKVPA